MALQINSRNLPTQMSDLANFNLRVREARSKILRLMSNIRQSTPRRELPTEDPKLVEAWDSAFDGQRCRRAIIYLRTRGCAWVTGVGVRGAMTLHPGCLDCAHSIHDAFSPTMLQPVDLLAQMRKGLESADAQSATILCVYNEGSLFNPAELPAPARRSILKQLALIQQFRGFIFESLPQFITDAVMTEVRDTLAGRRIEVGIGLESSSDIIRTLCINKPFTLAEFEASVHKIRDYGMKSLAYVMLKPSFLSETEAIDDAVATIVYAQSLGVDVVSIEPVNSSEYNLSGWLTKRGYRRDPWLWSVAEVISRSPLGIELRIGGQQFAPHYRNTAHNCDICSDAFMQAINEFNCTGQRELFRGMACDCKANWNYVLREGKIPLLNRIEDILSKVSDVDGQEWRTASNV